MHAPGAKNLLLTAYADTDVAIRRSTTSAWTTTCSSRGTRPRSGCTRSSTTCSTTGARTQPRAHLRRARGRPPVVRAQPRDQDVPGPQPRALPVVRRGARRRGRAAARARRRDADDLPLVLVPDGETLRSPTTLDLADALGPAHPGRAAAVRRVHRRRRAGRSGGRRVRRVRGAEHRRSWSARRPAARPGTSAAIENYLGFPKGLSGADLTHAGDGPGSAVRRRDGARPRRGRLGERGPVRAVLLAGAAA